MSISSALNSALSGLSATSRMAEVTASNISNALTEGYARREVQLSARVLGQVAHGVTVSGITRHVDKAILQDLRLSTAGQGNREPGTNFLTRLEQALGTPDQPGSLNARIAALERAVVEAAARPESDARLATIVDTARSLATGIGDLSRNVQNERQKADRQIAGAVKTLNDTLAGLSELNAKVRALSSAGRDVSGLLDQRQQMIDAIAEIVPIKEVARDHDQVAIFTTGGTILLDGRAARFDFTPTATITADMTLGSSALSGLTINGQPLTTTPSGGRLGEGRLAALFDLRDRVAPESQALLDGLARDLVERVSATAVDPTRPATSPALFTDGGAAFDPLNETGLAGRISLNPLVQPETGGALWRLRDGLGATTPGPAGVSDRLTALADALAGRRTQASGGLPTGSRSLAELGSDIISMTAVNRLSAESATSFAAARSDALRSELLRDGVDTDQEMQDLLLVEQAYGANAKVIQTVDEMINVLLGI